MAGRRCRRSEPLQVVLIHQIRIEDANVSCPAHFG